MANAKRTPDDLQRLVHDLEVHQAELEAQNTELVESQRALEASRSRYADLYDFAPVSYFTVGQHVQISEINLTGAEMLRVPRSYLIGHPLVSFIAPADKNRFVLEVRRAMREGSPLSFEVDLQPRGGDIIPVQVLCSPQIEAFAASATHCRIAFTDITRQRQAAEAAAAANQAKSQFLSNVSHELRTPMNAILGMTDLALGEALNPLVRDYLETVQDSAKSLLLLLNELLDLARLESGKFALEPAPFGLIDLVEDVCKGLGVKAFEKGLDFICDFDDRAPAWVVGDSLRLRQVLTNLVGNAIKFTERGEVGVRVTTVRKNSTECDLRFEVADTGMGIPPEDQDRIFEAFHQVDSTAARMQKGTGLGLSIAANLVRAMGAKIAVHSKLGQGSDFSFILRLPIHRDAAADSEDQAPVELRGVSVLLADPKLHSRQRLEHLLRRWGVRPVVASSGAMALERARLAARRGEPFRLMVLDAQTVGEEGVPLTTAVREDPGLAGTAVVVITPMDRCVVVDWLDRQGVTVQVHKPVSQADLLRAIRHVLGDKDRVVPANGEAPPPPQPERSRAPRRILLAEDTPANQKLVVRILEKSGHHVDIAENGSQAVEKATLGTYDLILMDVQMPEKDGLEATKEIRGLPDPYKARVPIIAMTAYAMEQDQQRCLDAGMDAYLSKPIERAALVEMIEVLARKSGC